MRGAHAARGTRGSLLTRIPLRAQIVCMVGSVGLVAATLTYCLVVMSVRVTLAGETSAAVTARVTDTLSWVVGAIVVCVVLASVGAAAVLRGTIVHALDRMHRAADEMATGRFAHRIASGRSDELGRLANGIDAMAERLETLESARRRMLASVSHELRTPLTVIRGHAFTLGRAERDSARAERYELIDRECARLASLIDELLVAATLRATPVAIVPVPTAASATVVHAARRFEAEAAERGIRVVAVDRSAGAVVDVDRERIAQVFANLVSNALDYAALGTTIDVAATQRDGCIRFSVTNRGETIPPGLLATITEPFVQGASPGGRVGLGLSIASDLVAAHASRLVVESADGVTRVSFALPVRELHSHAVQGMLAGESA